jgi:hypothetical protein
MGTLGCQAPGRCRGLSLWAGCLKCWWMQVVGQRTAPACWLPAAVEALLPAPRSLTATSRCGAVPSAQTPADQTFGLQAAGGRQAGGREMPHPSDCGMSQ